MMHHYSATKLVTTNYTDNTDSVVFTQLRESPNIFL